MKKEEIFEIAKQYFGEEYVEYKSDGAPLSCINVYFPQIVLTNNNNLQYTIYDVFVSIKLACILSVSDDIDEVKKWYPLRVTLSRSTFTVPELECGYVHSHCPRNTTDPTREGRFCFGSGPIYNTIERIKNLTKKEDEEDLWRLYFFELEQALKVESLSGTPYILFSKIFDVDKELTKAVNLEYPFVSINNLYLTLKDLPNISNELSSKVHDLFFDFIKHKNFKFRINNARIEYGEDIVRVYSELTKYLISHLTEKEVIDLCNADILLVGKIINNKLYKDINFQRQTKRSCNSEKYSDIVFKDKHFKFKIIEEQCCKQALNVIVNPEIFYFHFSKLLSAINYESKMLAKTKYIVL